MPVTALARDDDCAWRRGRAGMDATDPNAAAGRAAGLARPPVRRAFAGSVDMSVFSLS